MTQQIPLITPETLHKSYPLLPEHLHCIAQHRKIAKKIIHGQDKRLIVILGPCSIHDPALALEYGHHFNRLSKKIANHIFLIMRVFLEKPRTQFGWKGFIYDPFLDESHDVEKGLTASWELLRNLVMIEIPIATEFLDPMLSTYTRDAITWGVIGARTSASQIHRQLASQLSMPIGFKNTTDGNLNHAICGALAARHPQLTLSIDNKGKICSFTSCGNPFTHIILRGTTKQPNHDPISVTQTIQQQHLYGLHSRLLIDCAHGNSAKNPTQQCQVFLSILKQIQDGNDSIMGMMLESHLKGGNILSMTDPCLDWESTEELLLQAYQILNNS